MIRFFVPGTPRPQGSKRAFKLPNGKVSMVEASKGLADWRGDVRAMAMDAHKGELLEGPLVLSVAFVFLRPKGHYRTGKRSAELREPAPFFVTKAPDTSKLVRGIEDAMEGVIFKNDAQLAEEHARKRWANYGERPGAHILIHQLDEDIDVTDYDPTPRG